ncbi:hypothetical protein OPQ81_009746 [Rhizoctonia solani]|nr:hypothetical protein OPQ81_009746 [Rhizoctonia solani]
MSETLADSKYSPATIVGGRRVSFSRKPHPRHNSPPTANATQPEPTEPQDYPRPPPPPTFAAEHGLPIETHTEHKGAYAVPPHARGAPNTSPKTSFMHLHKSEIEHRQLVLFDFLNSASDVSSLTPLPNPRRIVTANNPTTGIGEVLINDAPQTTVGFNGVLREVAIWTTSQSPADNSPREDASLKPLEGLVSPGGTNCRVTDLGPGQVTPMHRTNSIDYNIIVSGRAVHVLEDGSEQEVGPGDVVIQRGTDHRWENRTNDWVRWISVLVEAKPMEINGKVLASYVEGADEHP